MYKLISKLNYDGTCWYIIQTNKGTSITLNRQLFLKPPIRRFQCRRALRTKIVALHMIPGFDDGVIKGAASEADALILMLYEAVCLLVNLYCFFWFETRQVINIALDFI